MVGIVSCFCMLSLEKSMFRNVVRLVECLMRNDGRACRELMDVSRRVNLVEL